MAGIKSGVKLLTKKGIGVTGYIGIGMTAVDSVSTYKEKRLQGKGVASSAISAGANAVMWQAVGNGAMLTLGALKHGPSMALNSYMKLQGIARSMDRCARNVAFANATFTDSKQAATMRQAGMQLAENSKYNLQQTLMGNEASSMHRL